MPASAGGAFQDTRMVGAGPLPGDGGVVTTPFEEMSNLAVAADGRLLVSGAMLLPKRIDSMYAIGKALRLNHDGSIDPSFNCECDFEWGVLPLADGSTLLPEWFF